MNHPNTAAAQCRQDAIDALIDAADYRQHVAFQADRLVDAATPHIRKMIEAEEINGEDPRL